MILARWVWAFHPKKSTSDIQLKRSRYIIIINAITHLFMRSHNCIQSRYTVKVITLFPVRFVFLNFAWDIAPLRQQANILSSNTFQRTFFCPSPKQVAVPLRAFLPFFKPNLWFSFTSSALVFGAHKRGDLPGTFGAHDHCELSWVVGTMCENPCRLSSPSFWVAGVPVSISGVAWR